MARYKQSSYLQAPKITFRDLPPSDQPRERLVRLGPGALSTVELLAIVLGDDDVELVMNLLAEYGNLAALARASYSMLVSERGMGPAKAARLQAALELGRRLNLAADDNRATLYTSADAAALLMAEIGHKEQEHLCVLFLDARYRILGIHTVYVGALSMVQFRAADLFREAVRRNCAAIVVGHNHPSGDPTPSPDDIAATRTMRDAGQLLGISLVDHIIVAPGRWVSLRDRRLGFDD